MFRKYDLPILSTLLMLLIVTTMLGITASVEAQEVHAFLIIMDNDPKPKSSFNVSVRQNLWNLQDMLNPLNVNLETWQAGRRSFQATDIINRVQNLDVQQGDTVFVYYSGHGYIQDSKHYLLLEKQSLASSLLRSDLAKAVSEKNCRLKMLMTDTCSDYIETQGPTDESIGIIPVGNAMADLFFKHRGFLDITAASPGQLAWGRDETGGYFTKSVTMSANAEADTNEDDSVSWEEVFAITQQKTEKYFSDTTFKPSAKREMDEKGQTTQTPIAYSLPLLITGGTAPSEPSEPAIQTTATLGITSTPSGATVYIDGTKVGTTPLRGHEIDTGGRGEKQVKVSLALEGYKNRETHIILESGKNKPWDVRLEKMQHTPRRVTSEMVLIPAGKFRMGTDELAGNESKPIHTVDLDAFYIDPHEVTVGEYKAFLLESGYAASLHRNLSEFSPTDDHPIVAVSWHDAMAYAQWAGKRLPTEAEWEKAARGGLMDMHFPWGNDEIDSSKANYGNTHGLTVPVGSYPANTYGLYDMAGNVAEWCMDPWDSNFYANSPLENPFAGHKSRDATIGDYKSIRGLRVVRGGSWSHTASPSFWVSGRHKSEAAKRYNNIGFRCVKDLPR